MKRIICLTILAALAIFLNPTVSSALITADFTGTRTAADDNQIIASGSWDNNFTISWEITEEDGVYTYTYTWDGIPESEANAVSHWILQVTAGSENDDFWDFEGETGTIEGIDTFGEGSGNPGIPGDIYGFKFDSITDGSLTFKTYKDPVWGDFYAKDGKDGDTHVYAYNAGFGLTPEGDFLGWIARPNGAPVVPEPMSMALFGSGLVGIAIRKRLS